MGSVPPIQGTGSLPPACPPGYVYNPATGLCDPSTPAPFDLNDPVIKQTVYGLSTNEVDPVQAAKNAGVGFAQSGAFVDAALAFWKTLWALVDNIVGGYFDVYDRLVALLAEEITAAVTRDRPGFWILIGSLISDLLGVNLDGSKLFQQLQSRGTLPAMQATGAGLIDLLIGEFTGTASGTGGNVSFSTQVDAATGLPQGTLTPAGGVQAAKALMGFVLTSAVRQANIDGLVDAIPYGFGQIFEKYSEGMRTNLGIGRMMRFALKPLFSVLVAHPLTEAINIEYRPLRLVAVEAFHAWCQQIFSDADLANELQAHGYTDTRSSALKWLHLKPPTREQLRTLHISGNLDDQTYLIWQRRLGYPDEVTALMDAADDLAPARRVILTSAEHLVSQYLIGKLSQQQVNDFVQGIAQSASGAALLSPGEVKAFTTLPVVSAALHHRTLGAAHLQKLFVNELITLVELQDGLTAAGYDPDTVTELTQEALLLQKVSAERAAAAAAKAGKAKLARLNLAQLATAFTDGLITIEQYRSELTARGFSASDVATLSAELLIKAGLQTGTTPTAT